MKKTLIFLFIPAFIYFGGCNSAVYEIVEVEEPVEMPSNSSGDSLNSLNTGNEIKENLKQEIKNESKFNDKQVVSKVYSIQLGAFSFESNASSFSKKAKSLVSQEIYYKNVEGLYKVRVGSFVNLSEAVSYMEQMKGLGFNDSFVVELTYIQTFDNK